MVLTTIATGTWTALSSAMTQTSARWTSVRGRGAASRFLSVGSLASTAVRVLRTTTAKMASAWVM